MYNVCMNSIKVACPAKINLSLKIINKRTDGFHNIKSLMQTINLYDFLTINVQKSDKNMQKINKIVQKNDKNEIFLTGNSQEIPYNDKNLVHKAANLFYLTTGINNVKTSIYIEKNIPISAGLAGGSSDAAGILYGLNQIHNNPLTLNELHNLCAQLGSDINVCLSGGKLLAQGRGEVIKKLEFKDFNLSLIKPKKLGISAKEAYTKFLNKDKNERSRNSYKNDLEWAIINDYEELKFIKEHYPKSMMTGSGSTYFIINDTFNSHDGYLVINNLKAINTGVEIVQ